MSDQSLPPSILVDGIQAMGVHNGVVRMVMMRLGVDGKPVPAVELLVPVAQVKAMMEALSKVAGR